MTPDFPLQLHDVVQLNERTANPAFRFAFMMVTEPKPWGAQGFVQTLGDRTGPGGGAYYRAKFEEMEYIGKAVLAPTEENNQ